MLWGKKHLNVALQSLSNFPAVPQLSPNPAALPGRAPGHGGAKVQHLGDLLFILYLTKQEITLSTESRNTLFSRELLILYFNK